MSLSGFLRSVADVREALKSVILALNEPLSTTASGLLESALSGGG